MRLGPYPNPSSGDPTAPEPPKEVDGRELLLEVMASWYARHFFQVKAVKTCAIAEICGIFLYKCSVLPQKGERDDMGKYSEGGHATRLSARCLLPPPTRGTAHIHNTHRHWHHGESSTSGLWVKDRALSQALASGSEMGDEDGFSLLPSLGS